MKNVAFLCFAATVQAMGCECTEAVANSAFLHMEAVLMVIGSGWWQCCHQTDALSSAASGWEPEFNCRWQDPDFGPSVSSRGFIPTHFPMLYSSGSDIPGMVSVSCIET